jgi:ABC-2 type transport system ATP-binding protein
VTSAQSGSDLAIDVRGLRKTYGALEALCGIDLQVARGAIFALIGPNGAGKTTAVEILEGYRSLSGGTVSVLGHDPWRNELDFKAKIGIVLQSTAVEPYLTVEEVIELFRGYYPHPRPLDEVIELVGLADKRSARVRRLSGGQQRRLDVAIGLAGDPELLFLDEPTTGFDPSARRAAWGMIKNLRAIGKTVFLTTHYMDEAQELADCVAIISKGRIVAEGTPRDLTGRAGDTRIAFRSAEAAAALPAELRSAAQVEDGRVIITTAEPTRTLHLLTSWAIERGTELTEITVSRSTLEDVYLSLTGEDESQEPES